MYALRRWWDRNGIRIGLVGLALGGAWLIRQTQGALIFEVYRVLTRPFDGQPEQIAQADNPRVRELEQRLIELESQNQQLQQLLGYVAKRPGKGIVAPVVGRSADHWWQQIVLGRGSRDGIKVGYIVSGNGGIVGRVTQVTPNTSRVLLISDPTSQVGVTISRSRHMGYIRGQAANRVVMEFFDKVPDVRPGDVVATSSYSRLFPAGLPVGTVESVNLNKSPAPEAVIELSAPISQLEWVILYPNPQVGESGQAEDNTSQTPAASPLAQESLREDLSPTQTLDVAAPVSPPDFPAAPNRPSDNPPTVAATPTTSPAAAPSTTPSPAIEALQPITTRQAPADSDPTQLGLPAPELPAAAPEPPVLPQGQPASDSVSAPPVPEPSTPTEPPIEAMAPEPRGETP